MSAMGDKGFAIQELTPQELSEALQLAWEVFLEFDAPDFSEEGVNEFKRFISQEPFAEKMATGECRMWGCYRDGELAGFVSTRPPCHIALLFVRKHHHRNGIARTLIESVREHYAVNHGVTAITVNSSPYAVAVYRRLGFIDIGPEEIKMGMRFIPMQWTASP